MKARDPRNGLRTTATLATAMCILGHIWLGFEQSWIDVIVALAAGYSSAFLFEYVDARANGRPVGFQGGGFKKKVDFLLAPHMTAVTTSFILYSQDHYWAMAVAVVTAIGSKYLFRVKVDGRYRHFFNPSNFGIAFTLTFLPWCSSLPWMYMAGLDDWGKIAFPIFTLILGVRTNILYVKRMTTIFSFVIAFVVQAFARSLLMGTPIGSDLAPLTGYVMILFLLFMITDPMTSPSRVKNQIIFGASMPLVYGVLMLFETVYVLFYSVWLVAAVRGLILYVQAFRAERAPLTQPSTAEPQMPAIASHV